MLMNLGFYDRVPTEYSLKSCSNDNHLLTSSVGTLPPTSLMPTSVLMAQKWSGSVARTVKSHTNHNQPFNVLFLIYVCQPASILVRLVPVQPK